MTLFGKWTHSEIQRVAFNRLFGENKQFFTQEIPVMISEVWLFHYGGANKVISLLNVAASSLDIKLKYLS